MKKLLIALTVLTGCVVSHAPIKGKYLSGPVVIASPKPFDSVWSNIIDLFATEGLTIKVIDRSSGLIVSNTSLIKKYTFEKAGALEHKNAWVVLGRSSYMNMEFKPNNIVADWNIRIKPASTGCTINVNLTNIDAEYEGSKGETYTFNGESTGVFEKTIADIVK